MDFNTLSKDRLMEIKSESLAFVVNGYEEYFEDSSRIFANFLKDMGIGQVGHLSARRITEDKIRSIVKHEFKRHKKDNPNGVRLLSVQSHGNLGGVSLNGVDLWPYFSMANLMTDVSPYICIIDSCKSGAAIPFFWRIKPKGMLATSTLWWKDSYHNDFFNSIIGACRDSNSIPTGRLYYEVVGVETIVFDKPCYVNEEGIEVIPDFGRRVFAPYNTPKRYYLDQSSRKIGLEMDRLLHPL